MIQLKHLGNKVLPKDICHSFRTAATTAPSLNITPQEHT